MILNIIKYGSDDTVKLRGKNIDVKKENPNLQQLIDDMFETLENSKNGVGLAAPQVGVKLNLFIILTPTFREVFINPEVRPDGLSIQTIEGCLSFPDMTFPVYRREKIKIKYYDKNWNYLMREFDKELAIIVQHEYDHLNGVLIVD